MLRRRIATQSFAILLAFIIGTLAPQTGCTKQPRSSQYDTLTGIVETRDAETGELSVQEFPRLAGRSRTVLCVINKDAEVYVNDRFSTIDRIQIGDTIELIGHRDADPQLERFIVSFASITRILPPPPPPDLTPPPAPAAENTGEK
ncbi:MAG: hypothetical protein IH986_02950 [Planctomycetes bacterium]|nr:hypothetical protein [Planctomycetota bacterium]